MARKCKYRKWNGLSAILASVLAISTGALTIANANAAFINLQLGTSNQKYVTTGESNIDTTYFKSEFSSLEDLVLAKNALAEEISEEGTVLLKNNNSALPLNVANETVTLWGLNSHNVTLGGMIGSSVALSEGQTEYTLEKALIEKGYKLNETMIELYSSDDTKEYGRTRAGHSLNPSFAPVYENPNQYNVGELPASFYPSEVLASADNTTGVVVISRDCSEAADYEVEMTTGKDDTYERPLALSTYEQEMIELAKQHSTKVIVLLNTSSPVEIDSLKNDDEIDSIVWVGHPGANGFLGVADVLGGEVNPSGHLTDTYAVNSASSPAMRNYGVYCYTNASNSGEKDAMQKANKADWFVVEGEGIYVGYKYYETRYEDAVLGRSKALDKAGSSTNGSWNYASEVSYPFGYGLSYTTFSQTLDNVEVNVGESSVATVTVTNTGNVAGKSVAQLYVQTPYTVGGLEKSAIQLVGYAKTDILTPGESQTLRIDFDTEYFASYDQSVLKADNTTGAWVLESGDYYFAVGNGAHEALNNILATKTGNVDQLVLTAESDVIDTEKVQMWTLEQTDIETYSVNVQNELADMDINTFLPGTVEYTTRSDWTKGWETVTSLTPTEEMMTGLNNKLYELTENGDGVNWGVDSGLIILDAMEFDEAGNFIGVKDLDDEIWDKLVDQMTLDEAIQFIEKGGDDVENVDSILLLRTYANDGPIGFAYDQVNGYATRWTKNNAEEPTYVDESNTYAKYSMATMPTDPVVAATFNAKLQAREGELFAEDALWSNESALFAPGVNLHRVPYNARNHEYYSEDSILTSLTAVAVVDAAEEKGLMMEPKHFAFNHQESNRSGVSTFLCEQGAREGELRCFQKLMAENHCSGIMTAFNRAGTKFVGAYENLLKNIARDEWGYQGWYNTDMINGADYMNWRDVTYAGGGNCLTTSAYETSEIGNMSASKSKIEKDTDFQEMMKYNIKFFLYKLAGSNAMNGVSVDTEIHKVLTWYQWLAISIMAVSGVGTIVTGFVSYKTYKKHNKEGV